MPKGGTLRIALEPLLLTGADAERPPEIAPGRFVCVRVSDDGVGMDEATRARIFEPFFTTKGPGLGTGLGLASVFGSVSQAGGFIRVCSSPGMGTRFDLYFPRADEAQLPSTQPQASEAPARRGRERILMVEDDEGVRAVVTLILSEAGYDVMSASSLSEARSLQRGDATPFALMITDMVLPDGRGLELAKELRVLQPGLAVLCMSGYADGADGHSIAPDMARLQKPFSADELLDKVRALIDPAESQAALSA
jgi:CheY-like chemotaxis protein